MGDPASPKKQRTEDYLEAMLNDTTHSLFGRVSDDDSPIRPVDRLRDEIPIERTDSYICLMKLFPTCTLIADPEHDAFERFHLRIYFPFDCIHDISKRAERVVIMTNGLDEFEYFTLYDQIGCRLAALGVTSVLLPLPDHLNRHVRHRYATPSAQQLEEKPSGVLMAQPEKLYQSYFQYRAELGLLLRHIRGIPCPRQSGPCGFFSRLFSPSARVSYLGYSMGAGAMLCDFLVRQKELSACFLLSGAINLRDIIVDERMFSQRQWERFIATLEERVRVMKRPEETDDGLAHDLFCSVFLNAYPGDTARLLAEHARRLLFFYGGRDGMTTHKLLEDIAPKKWGLSVVLLPGINHFLGIDEEWKRWMPLVVQLMARFEQNAVCRTLTRADARRSPDDADILTRAALLGWSSRDAADQETETMETRKRIRESELRTLRVGERLLAMRLIRMGDLRKAVAIQRLEPSRGRLGSILVGLGVVTRGQVEAVMELG